MLRRQTLDRRAVQFTFYFNERIKRLSVASISLFATAAAPPRAVAAATRGDDNFARKIPLMGDATRDLRSRDWPTSFWGMHRD